MKKAVVLINLGTPDAPTTKSVRSFLKVFLSDRRVVEISRWLWMPILYLIILPFRSPKVAKKYQPLWAMGDSPLRLFSQQLVDKLQAELRTENVEVRLAMTYGSPALESALDELLDSGVEHISFIPLYPQYSATTTAAALDAITKYFQKRRDIPSWNWLRDYYADSDYIEALADTVRTHWNEQGQGECLLISFHGIPKRNIELGDPYQKQCEETAMRLANTLELKEDQWKLTFQSRLGKAEWLQPYTDKTVEALAKKGVKRLDIVAPSFATECLETLEELDTEAAEIFYENGGERFSYVPCLNSSEKHVKLLARLAVELLGVRR